MDQTFSLRVLLLPLAAVLSAGCGASPKDTARSVDTVDSSLSCPSGQVGWNFSATPPDFSSEQYERQAADGGYVPLLARTLIGVTSATCAGQPSSELAALKTACAGRTSCDFATTCTGDFAVHWTCADEAADGGDFSTTLATTATRRTAQLACAPRSAAGPAPEARTACVPKYCRGKTRRDTQLGCVPDLTMPVLHEEDLFITVPTLTSHFAAYEPDDTSAEAKAWTTTGRTPFPYRAPLFENGLYDIATSVTLPASLQDVPLRLVLWFSDEWSSDRRTTASTFRCVATTFDVVPNGGGILELKRTTQLSQACTSAATTQRGKQEATRLLQAELDASGSGTVGDVYANGSILHVSLDLEGRALLVPDGHTETTACGPNPTGFFFDSANNRFDQYGYYAQRQVDARVQPYLNKPTYQFQMAYRAELGPKDVSVRKPFVEIPVYSSLRTTVPLDFTWYLAHDSAGHPFSPSNETFPELHLRAEVYMVPTQAWATDSTGPYVGGYPLLATIPLTGGSNPEGATVSVDAPLPNAIREQLFNEGSKLYIPPDKDSRSYNLLACIVSDYPTTMFEPHGFYSWVTPRFTLKWTPKGDASKPDVTLSLGNTADATAAYSPYSNIRPGRGCRFASAPLVIKPDRYRRPLTPMTDAAWAGNAAEATSGSPAMSGTADNDAERTCVGGKCRSVSSNAMGGQGEFARSYYAVTTESVTDTGEGFVDGTPTSSPSLGGSARAEVLGYQVLDPGDDADDSTPWPATATASTPVVTFTFTPPFDTIANRLNKLAGRSPVEWKTGRYSGAMGIGVGLGLKIPVQMGPIPGLITITLSAGVGLEASLTFRVFPESGQPYPCMGSGPCLEFKETGASLADAADDCTSRGGRLADLATQADATALTQALASKSGEYWLGSQLAYRYRRSQCASNWDAQSCPLTTDTTFRWLNKDTSFGSRTGTGAYTGVAGTAFELPPGLSLPTRAPAAAGVTLGLSGADRILNTREASSEYPYVCRFDGATSTRYLETALALRLSAGAGFGLSFCSPNDEIGICLEANINAVSIALEPSYTHTETTVKKALGTPRTQIASDELRADWSVTLLEGAVTASIHLWWTSFSWDIVTFDGFRVAGGTLFSTTSTSNRSLQ